MVLRGRQRQRRLAVGQAEEACFLAVQESFDHHFRAGRAEGAGKAVVDGGHCVVECHGHGYALAGGKPVRLDDDRCALLALIGLGRGGIGEPLVGAGRNIVAGAKVLGEPLGALQLRGRRRGSEDGKAGVAQTVRKTRHQRRLRADDDEPDVLTTAEVDDGGMIVGVEGHKFRMLGDARVAGGGK